MANLYNVPLKNSVQKTLAVTLTQAETGSITFDSSVASELQADSLMKGILVIDRVDVNGVITPSKTEYIAFTGVSGSTVTGLTRGIGGTSAQGHNIGAIVEFVADVTWAQAINDVFTLQHNSDGTHKALSGLSLASATITNPTISGGSLASTTILTSNIDTFSFKNINAPEGFLINGKIVPTVASNNLTVAIKTMAGNDPSASDPVYVKIDDAVRTISGALSVTTNAGTNWFNAGSTELATKEIDYFVYLGWEATASAVRVGFGRISSAERQDDYNSTNTNEKHIAFDDDLNSGDVVKVIGRFAATLSAGAGFTWSVPTFTSTNLIQRPIYETRWLDFVPVISSSMGLAITSYRINQYKITSNKANVQIDLEFTTSGTPASSINCTTPISATAATKIATLACTRLFDGGDLAGLIADTGTANLFAIRKYNIANWGIGTTRYLMVSGDYQI